MLNFANILTLSRILAIPLIIVTFYWDSPTNRWIACGLFAAAAITDFFDGYVARKWDQVSHLGRFLDPIADKLLVAAVLLMLAGFERLSPLAYLPALVILMREILVSGLREFLAQLQVSVPVTQLAKWKTTIQLIALPVLVVGDAGPAWLYPVVVGEALLWIAAALTLITGYDYLIVGLKHMREKDGAQS